MIRMLLCQSATWSHLRMLLKNASERGSNAQQKRDGRCTARRRPLGGPPMTCQTMLTSCSLTVVHVIQDDWA